MTERLVAFPGTCGELFQGTLGGTSCLVSCPIDRMARLKVSRFPGEGVFVPPAMTKTRRAVGIALGLWSSAGGAVRVERVEALPEGKGYASSTADILGALYGLSSLDGRPLAPEEATSIALSVEPTDSLAWPGLALLDHRNGEIMEYLGTPPPMSVLVLDWGGTMDTEEFNRRDAGGILSRLASVHAESFGLVRDGILKGDAATIGEGASLSAAAAGLLRDMSHLDECRALSRSLGGYGVCAAHSGTLYGILMPPDAPRRYGRIADLAGTALSPGWEGALHAVVPGGPRTGDERNAS
jgi:L-threonine kinase